MLDLFSKPYPRSPGFKRGGTSKDAAAAIAPAVETLRAAVLAQFVASGHHGLTADQCAGRLGRSVLAIRPRVSELVDMGKLRDTGSRRTNVSGRSAVVWMAR